jgi:hypothetical protein
MDHPDEHGACTASDRFKYVGTAPDTAVNIDFDLATHCIDYLRFIRGF